MPSTRLRFSIFLSGCTNGSYSDGNCVIPVSYTHLDFKEINICANINDNEHNHDYKNVTVSKTFDVTGDKSRGNVYFVDYSQDSENYRVLFQPTSKMIESIKRFNPRNVFVMED